MMSRRPEKRERPRPIWMALAALAAAALLMASAVLIAGCGKDDLASAREAEEAGDLAAAAQMLQGYLVGHPDDLDALKQLAGILYLQRKWDEALPVQQKVVALDPDEAQIRVELGFNYLNHQHRPADAVAVFQEASVVEPTAQYLGFLAQAQIRMDDAPGAETTLRKAIATDKTYPHAYDLLIALLEKQGRQDETAELRDAAESAGVILQSGGTAP